MESKIFTIGHSTHQLSFFINLLRVNDIQVVVDVRTYPRSKYNPQFNKETLKDAVERRGIQYVWYGDRLGGLGQNIDFDGAIDKLIDVGSRKNVCVMCSEGNYEKCHRYTMIQPALEKKDAKVIHIMPDGQRSVKQSLF